MSRDKYDDCAEELPRGRYRDGIKKNWTVYFQGFFFETISAVTHFVALIGCRPIQSRPEAFWSVPVGDTPWKSIINSVWTNCSWHFVLRWQARGHCLF